MQVYPKARNVCMLKNEGKEKKKKNCVFLFEDTSDFE